MRAAIDLGSNSVLLTVMDGSSVVHDEARVVGLGKGLGDGGDFASDRMVATLSALSDYAACTTRMGLAPHEVIALTTSSARRANNAASFFAEVRRRTGFEFRVISGSEEAELTWRGARGGLGLTGSVAVVDLGGGSTEIAMGEEQLDWETSFEIGSVRLTERLLGSPVPPCSPKRLEDLRQHARKVFSAVEVPRASHVVGVAGSVTSLMSTVLGLDTFDGKALHGATLTAEHLQRLQAKATHADAEARRALFSASPARADFLLAGSVILSEALVALNAGAMTVSTRGLRYGALETNVG